MHAPLPFAVMRFAVPASKSATSPGIPTRHANDVDEPSDGARTPSVELPLVLPRALALDLLEWIGLGRPEFGAVRGRELAPLCRRRLWPMPRNLDPGRTDRHRGTLRARTAQLLGVAEEAGDGLVTFG